MWSDWLLSPELLAHNQLNVFQNMVFDNVTSVDNISHTDSSTLTTRLSALAVDLQCEPFDDDDVPLFVWPPESDDAPYKAAEFAFYFRCATKSCSERTTNANRTVDLGAHYADYVQYEGSNPYSNANHAFQGGAGNLPDSLHIVVMVADFSSLAGPVANYTEVPSVGANATQDMFNVTLPTFRGIFCIPSFSHVTANVTLERQSRSGLNGSATLLQWAVVDADLDGVSVIEELDLSSRAQWIALFPPGNLPRDGMDQSGFGDDWSQLNDDSLRPSAGMSTDFFELLASYQQSKDGNLTQLLNVTELANAARAVYQMYNTQLLAHFRPYAQQSSSYADSTKPAVLTFPQARVKPDAGATFAVVGMLGAVFVMLLIIFGITRGRGAIRSKPGMISTQLSLLAGSRLVQQLRSDPSGDIWDERVGLGWWKADTAEEPTDMRSIRWGIDVGVLDTSLQERAKGFVAKDRAERE